MVTSPMIVGMVDVGEVRVFPACFVGRIDYVDMGVTGREYFRVGWEDLGGR
jgi:hypothetical protein